jgi:hypothetical protein
LNRHRVSPHQAVDLAPAIAVIIASSCLPPLRLPSPKMATRQATAGCDHPSCQLGGSGGPKERAQKQTTM